MVAIRVEGDEERDELVRAMMALNTEAKACKPSPRWAELHECINGLLDQIVGR